MCSTPTQCKLLPSLGPPTSTPAVPLGGLVGDNIYLVPERVKRLASRLHKWVALRRTPPQVRAAVRQRVLLRGPALPTSCCICVTPSKQA